MDHRKGRPVRLAPAHVREAFDRNAVAHAAPDLQQAGTGKNRRTGQQRQPRVLSEPAVQEQAATENEGRNGRRRSRRARAPGTCGGANGEGNDGNQRLGELVLQKSGAEIRPSRHILTKTLLQVRE